VRFEWDPGKAAQNRKKHGVSFEEAATVLFDPLSATFDDPDHSGEEERYVTIGYSFRGKLLVIAHTDKEASIRIISARQATSNERKRHERKA
jgi:uncharacterized DUF497 family protein